MNRLQKKCLIATAGFHLLLVLAVVFGSAFFTEHPKTEETQVLDVIPASLVEAAFNSGVKGAQPPAPKPVARPPEPQPPVPPPPTPTPVPPPAKPAVTPPTLTERVEKLFEKPETEKVPADTKSDEPAPKPVKSRPVKPKHEIKVDLTQVTRTTSTRTDTSAADAAREARRLERARLKAIAQVARAIKDNASSATEVEMPGSGSVSYANYASAVKSIYEQAWIPPNDSSSDDANIKVSVTISRDGSVVTSRILDRSGDAGVDASVQRALDRVTFVAPFPDGAKEKQKTFIINFNLKAKRMLG